MGSFHWLLTNVATIQYQWSVAVTFHFTLLLCVACWTTSPSPRDGRWGSLWTASPTLSTTTAEPRPTSTLALENPRCERFSLFFKWGLSYGADGFIWIDGIKIDTVVTFLFHRENGPQITYVRDFKAKVQYFRFWCQVCPAQVANVAFATFLLCCALQESPQWIICPLNDFQCSKPNS